MLIGRYRIQANWGHLAFATLLIVLCMAYLYDAASTSTDIENILLVLPATVMASILYLVILGQEVKLIPKSVSQPKLELQAHRLSPSQLRTPALMVLVGAYLLAMSYSGFDISTFLFIAASLAVQGERRPLVLFGYSAVFAIIVVLGMKALLPFPFPTLIL